MYIAMFARWCENSDLGTLHLTNGIVFGGSAVSRSRGEKHERTLDVVPGA
jgi:hypothetical protein